MQSTKSYVRNSAFVRPRSSAVRKNFRAAASSRKPMTTFSAFIQEPLLGSFRNKVGNRARKKKGAAKVPENARPPRRLSYKGRGFALTPAKPPRNGATQVKLMIVNVRAMNIVPTKPPRPSRAAVKLARPAGKRISYIPNRLKAKSKKRTPSARFVLQSWLSF